MPVKDVYGREVREQNHMILAHSPTSMLIEELRKRKMSDREIMDSKPWKSINNPDLWRYTSNLKKMPNQFVIKTNHASGVDFIEIVKNKSEADLEKLVKKMNRAVKLKFGLNIFVDIGLRLSRPQVFLSIALRVFYQSFQNNANN